MLINASIFSIRPVAEVGGGEEASPAPEKAKGSKLESALDKLGLQKRKVHTYV